MATSIAVSGCVDLGNLLLTDLAIGISSNSQLLRLRSMKKWDSSRLEYMVAHLEIRPLMGILEYISFLDKM